MFKTQDLCLYLPKLAFTVSALLSFLPAFAQSAEKGPIAIVEVGSAASRSLTEGESSFGPTVAVEATPIERWLELEVGFTPLFQHHSTESSIDLLFKKPWTLSDKAEFMLGVGPECLFSHVRLMKNDDFQEDCAQ